MITLFKPFIATANIVGSLQGMLIPIITSIVTAVQWPSSSSASLSCYRETKSSKAPSGNVK